MQLMYDVQYLQMCAIYFQPNNSSQCKDPVFRVPVAGAAFLQKSTVPGILPTSRSLNQTLGVPVRLIVIYLFFSIFSHYMQ